MKFYKDIRQALEASPTTWTLIDTVIDDDPLPDFPAIPLEIPRETGQVTPRRMLRNLLLKQTPSDPSLLYTAVERGILSREEALDILHSMWGKAFNLDDFAPERR